MLSQYWRPRRRDNNSDEVSSDMPIKYSALQRANLALQLDSLVVVHAISARRHHARPRANRFSMAEVRESRQCFSGEEIARGNKACERDPNLVHSLLGIERALSGSSLTEK